MKNNRGFTLIEIIVSLAIISIALVTLMTVFNRTVASAAQSFSLTGAVMIAKEKIALIGLKVSPKPGVFDWKDDERYPRYRYRETITETSFYDVKVYMVEIEVRFDGKDAFKITKYVKKG